MKKKLGKKWISLHLNEFNLKDGFENYIVAKILMRLKMIKRYGRKKKKKKNTHTHTHTHTIQHSILILFAALFLN